MKKGLHPVLFRSVAIQSNLSLFLTPWIFIKKKFNTIYLEQDARSNPLWKNSSTNKKTIK
jgi:hypothetical protein